MMASLRLSGLDVDEAVWPSLLPSPPSLDSAGLTGALISEFNVVFEALSKLLRSDGEVLLEFSCPPAGLEEVVGVALPLSEAWLKTRLMGLLGDVRVRDVVRAGAVFERV
jgi:hypothetical protein